MQFTKHPNLKYGFSKREDGSMHRHAEKEKRDAYFKKIGINPNRVVTADVVHGELVACVGNEMAGKMAEKTTRLSPMRKTYLSP